MWLNVTFLTLPATINLFSSKFSIFFPSIPTWFENFSTFHARNQKKFRNLKNFRHVIFWKKNFTSSRLSNFLKTPKNLLSIRFFKPVSRILWNSWSRSADHLKINLLDYQSRQSSTVELDIDDVTFRLNWSHRSPELSGPVPFLSVLTWAFRGKSLCCSACKWPFNP